MVEIKIDLHLHGLHPPERDASGILQGLVNRILVLERKDSSMANDISNVKQLVADVKKATDDLATRVATKTTEQDDAIQALKDRIANGQTITQEDLDGLSVDLSAEVAQLQAIGADPQNPVPPIAQPPTT